MKQTDDCEGSSFRAEMAPAALLLRGRVHAYLEARVLPRGEEVTVLELGCRGANAVFLGRLGHRVVATNPCGRLLEEARIRAQAEEFGDRVVFQTFDVRSDQSLGFAGSIDLILGDFGALNTLEPRELRQLAVAATRWVHEGGRAVFVIMPPVCIWETASNVLTGRWREAGRRSAPAMPGRAPDGALLPTWYHGPAAVKAAFAPAFEVRHIEPLGLALPPFSQARPVAGRPPVLNLLSAAERAVRVVPGLARFSDHYLVDLQRTGAVTVARQTAEIARRRPHLVTEPVGRAVSRSSSG